jgi:sugar lactone lactonase YvrE
VKKVTPAHVLTVFSSAFAGPASIAIDEQDNIYVGEIFTQNVYQVTPAGVKILYGNANLATISGAGASRLAGMGFDRTGNLYCGTYGDGTFWPGPFAYSRIPAGGGMGIQMPARSLPAIDFAPCNSSFYIAG